MDKERTSRGQYAAEVTVPLSNNRTNTSLCDLPAEIVDKIFLILIDTPLQTRTLEDRSLEQAEYAYLFATSGRDYFKQFRRTIHSLTLDWDSPVNINALARLFGPNLRKLTLRSHSLSASFLNTLSETPVPLNYLHLSNCVVPSKPLLSLAHHARSKLRTLDLQFISNADVSYLVTCLSNELTHLKHITLRGMLMLTHHAVISIIAASGPCLRSVALRNLRHTSIGDDTLQELAQHCPQLTSLFLEDIRHATPLGVKSSCIRFASTLSDLRLFYCDLSEHLLRSVVTSCKSLTKFGLDEGPNSPLRSGGVTACLASLGGALQELHLRDVSGLCDFDILQIIQNAPNLEHVTIRRAPSVTDRAVFEIASLGTRLIHLDLRGCFTTDDALYSIARRCTRIQFLALGGDRQYVTAGGAARLGSDAVSNQGLEAVLVGCGQSLDTFVWETPRSIVRDVSGRESVSVVGVANLSAKGLAKSLRLHCPRLRRVEVNGLRPSGQNRVERARCDLAFIELEEAVRNVAVFLDRQEAF